MANLWKNRKPPTPFKWDTLSEEIKKSTNNTTTLRDQVVWSLKECADVFKDSVKALKVTMAKLPEGDHLVWDKDDKYAMEFVASCANIRSQIFNIPKKSCFDIKAISGNIIPGK